MEGTMYDLIVAFGKCIADTCYDNLIVALANGDHQRYPHPLYLYSDGE